MHCRLLLTVKRQRDGSVDKFKARLVADGNTQKYKVDFDRIFSTVVKTATIRLVLSSWLLRVTITSRRSTYGKLTCTVMVYNT